MICTSQRRGPARLWSLLVDASGWELMMRVGNGGEEGMASQQRAVGQVSGRREGI